MNPRCFPCVRELKHSTCLMQAFREMFPVCAGIEIQGLHVLTYLLMFPVCAGIETPTATCTPSSARCFPCVRELKYDRTRCSGWNRCFPCMRELKPRCSVSTTLDTCFPCMRELKLYRRGEARGHECFPCMRELKQYVYNSTKESTMFPVYAGIERIPAWRHGHTAYVSRVCGN